MNAPQKRVILAVTGASGAPYARRCLAALVETGVEVHLLLSKTAVELVKDELGITLGSTEVWAERLLGKPTDRVIVHRVEQYHSSLASGGMLVDGMVVIPCSMGRLGSFASGLSRDLIDRAVEVTLKEGRKLVLVPRETPLSQISIENMLKLSRAGATILPAMPAFYTHPKTLDDAVDFVVGKVLDQLTISHSCFPRYGIANHESRATNHA